MNRQCLTSALMAVASLSLIMFSGCAEKVGSGQSVAIPIVSIACTTTYCRSASSANVYVVYTTSSCANAQFGETVAGSTNLSCNGFGCTGTITNFTGTTGSSANTIPEGFYSVCAILDFNSNYLGTAVTGDSTGALANTSIASGTSTRTVNAFTDL